MDGTELGAILRARRVSAGRTVASVATDAGLSMPYVANLENGRGNPTVSALRSWASALGLRIELTVTGNDDVGEVHTPSRLPATLSRFSRAERFLGVTELLARNQNVPVERMRERVLTAMTAVAATSERSLSQLDWHRILDIVERVQSGTT